jgi:hypothetical protein
MAGEGDRLPDGEMGPGELGREEGWAPTTSSA